MDIARTVPVTPKWRRPKVLITAAVLLGLSGMVAAMRLVEAHERVDADTVSIGDVQRGEMKVTVQANGLLLPSTVSYVAAQVDGRVDEVKVKAGAAVQAGDLLVQLSNPVLHQQAEETRWALEAMEAELNALRVQLDSELLNSQATVSKAQFAYDSAKLQLDAQSKLIATHVVSQLDYRKSELNVKQLAETLELEKQRLQRFGANLKAQLQAKDAQVSKLRKTLQRASEQVAALSVRAPISGMVQESPLQPGQRVLIGANMVKIAQPESLYAELQVQETLARDLAVGQPAEIDTRNGVVEGRVSRVDLAVTKGIVKVDVELTGEVPKGARPDLSIEGRIRVSELADAVYLPRPAQVSGNQTTTVFKVNDDGIARRVPVQFGIASARHIEIKSGLDVGDRVLLSDTSKWAHRDSLRLN